MSASLATSKNVRLLTCTVIGLVALSACTASRAVPADPAVPLTSVREMTDKEARTLWDAEQILTRDCMAGHGFAYWPAPYDPIPDDRDFPYVVDDPAWARRHGYGGDIREQIDRLRERNPNRRYLDGLPPERRRAAFVAINGEGPRPGTRTRGPDEVEARLPEGGVVRRSAVSCTSQAQRRLYGDLPTWYRVAKVTEYLKDAARARVTRDPRYTTAISTWSACMRGRGHPYGTPPEARAKVTQLEATAPSTRKAREKEIRTAVAEATCARETNLPAVIGVLEREHTRALSERYRLDVTTAWRMRRDALPRAAEITARH
ncbi:hypothetical protein AB0395_20930 [Streptosporangium sp. NPDC051023]|uniref:hypothetical protein n=1 Tax=Streptosporangium sp. NPDC051023 TaxID=3155410 RepID=UPI0034509E24